MSVLRIFLILAAVVVAGVVAVLTLMVGVKVLPGFTPAPVWSASSGKPAPVEFLVVCYPASDGRGAVQLYDKADGVPVAGATLQRAVANTLAEMARPWVEVNTRNGDARWVRTADLRYEPPANATVDYDAALAEAKKKAGSFAVSVNREIGRDGTVKVELEWMPDDDHVELYTYTIVNNVATPMEVRRYFGPGEVFKNVPQLLAVVAAAGVAGLVMLVIGVRLAYRMTRKPMTVALP